MKQTKVSKDWKAIVLEGQLYVDGVPTNFEEYLNKRLAEQRQQTIQSCINYLMDEGLMGLKEIKLLKIKLLENKEEV